MLNTKVRRWAITIAGAMTLTILSPQAGARSFGGEMVRTVREVLTQEQPEIVKAEGTIEIVFAPGGPTTDVVVRFIGEARQRVRVSAYGFTSNEVGRALVEAQRRGVDVRVVVDREHNGRRSTPNSVASFLVANQIPVRVDTAVPLQHNKVVLVDGVSVMNGSWNLTHQAARNAENITIHRQAPALTAIFERNWNKLWAESQPLSPTY
jgi:phosphatidylserine/phosphatidylglycerophosphate/cardiolipin synthase-like enzyme